MTKRNVSKQVKELIISFQSDTLQPGTEADLIFSAPEGSTEVFQNYGHVSTLDCPDPRKCSALEKGVIGGKSTIVIQATDFRGAQCKKPVSLECELVSVITGIKARDTTVERRGQSQYQISYLPTIAGKHRLHVKISGQHIKGSPFDVNKKHQLRR